MSLFIPRLTLRERSEKKNKSTSVSHLCHAVCVSESSDVQMHIFDTKALGRLTLLKHESRGISSNSSNSLFGSDNDSC